MPTVFLIYNLTDAQRQTLILREIWSSKTITFRVTTMDPIRPDYLFSIRGLITKSIDEVRDTVLQVWKGQAAQDFILSLQQTIPDPLLQQASATLQDVTKSLKITMLDTKDLGGTSAPSFNIYIQAHLIPDDSLWCHLRNFFASQEYALPFQQPGRAGANFFHCTICHSIDHPRGLCHFPTTEGWNGPTWRIQGVRCNATDRNKNALTMPKKSNWGDSPAEWP